jgi:hypothetical protein
LSPACAASATSGPETGHGQERRDQRDQRCQQRPEDQQEQNQDEDHRQALDLVPRAAGLGLLVDVDGELPGQVHLQPGRRPSLGDLRAQILDQVGHAGFVAAADVGQHLQLLSLLVRRPA